MNEIGDRGKAAAFIKTEDGTTYYVREEDSSIDEMYRNNNVVRVTIFTDKWHIRIVKEKICSYGAMNALRAEW